MKKHITELHKELTKIFKKHTTTHWKNDCVNEGDRESEELIVYKRRQYHNISLLETLHGGNTVRLSDKNGMIISVGTSVDLTLLRFDMRSSSFADNQYYYISMDRWEVYKEFILHLCSEMYKVACIQKDLFDEMETVHNGETNPIYVLKYYRQNQLDKIL